MYCKFVKAGSYSSIKNQSVFGKDLAKQVGVTVARRGQAKVTTYTIDAVALKEQLEKDNIYDEAAAL